MTLLRRKFLDGAVRALHAAGADRSMLRFANRFEARRDERGAVRFPFVQARREPSLQILLYHRVTPEPDPYLPPMPLATFRSQMEHLATHFRVYRLDDAIAKLMWGGLADNAVAITFDDGYRDNFEHAWPVLSRFGLPATIFLATGAIGTGELLWHDRVFRAFAATSRRELRAFGPEGDDWPMATPERRLHSRSRFVAYLRTLDNADRARWVAELESRLDIAPDPRDRALMLTWDEARRMAAEGAHFGAHTVTHPILSRLSREEARREIVDSKAEIERELGVSIDCFAYPTGRPVDYDEAIKQMLREAGFRTAVTTRSGSNRRDRGVQPDVFDILRSFPGRSTGVQFSARMAYHRFAY